MSGKTQEYPKALYAEGQLEGHTVVVFNADEEAIKREEGYKSLNQSDDHAEKDALIEEGFATGHGRHFDACGSPVLHPH